MRKWVVLHECLGTVRNFKLVKLIWVFMKYKHGLFPYLTEKWLLTLKDVSSMNHSV